MGSKTKTGGGWKLSIKNEKLWLVGPWSDCNLSFTDKDCIDIEGYGGRQVQSTTSMVVEDDFLELQLVLNCRRRCIVTE